MYEEEEDEDYINDIISLNYGNIKTEPIIDLVTSSDDEPEDDKSQIGISWYGNKSFVLPISFFDVASNVEFLKECRPLSIKVVDCDKNPSYYNKLLRPKTTALIKTDEAHTKNLTLTENKQTAINVTERVKLNTKVTKVIIPVPNCSQSKNEIDQGKAHHSLKNHSPVSNNEQQKAFKSKDSEDPTPLNLKGNKSLVGLVAAKKDEENTARRPKNYSADKKATNEIGKKDLIKDVGTALQIKFKTMITGIIEHKFKDMEKRSSNNGCKNEPKKSKKIDMSNKNEQSSEGSPTRCSIKMTSSKTFEKAVKLKKTHGNKAKDKANSEISLTSALEKNTTKNQIVPKLSLKRKNSEVKDFYVVTPTKEKSKSHGPNKKSKISGETRERLQSKCKHLKAKTEIQRDPTESDSKIASSIRDSSDTESTLTASPPPWRPQKHRKSGIVKPKHTSNNTPNTKSNLNSCDLGKGTVSTEIENKALSLKRLLKNQEQCNHAVQKSDDKPVKSKSHINGLNPTHSNGECSAKKSIENNSSLREQVSQMNRASEKFKVFAHNNIRNEIKHTDKYVIIQNNTPPAHFKSTFKNMVKKAQENSRDYQVQSYVYVPLDPSVSVANSNINISQTEKNSSMNKDLLLTSMKQSGVNADMVNRIESYGSYPESQNKSAPHNLYPTYKNIPNPNTLSGSTNDFNSSSNLAIPTNIIIRHPKAQLPNELLMAKNSSIFYAKKTTPPSYKETGDSVKQPQEKEMQHKLQSTQPHPAVMSNDCSNLARPVYSNPPVNKAIILKGTPAYPQPNTHPHYGNPIPTVVNHNPYQPRLPVVRPLRFMSPWPPPNTNVAHIGPQVNMEYSNPRCRMPFVHTRLPMYTEQWRPPMHDNYTHHFMCSPPQPPPPPPLPVVPLQRHVTPSLLVEPPVPTGTVIGSNAEGQLIKKITIVAPPSSEPPVVHDKEKMLAELNSAVEELEAASEKTLVKINKEFENVKVNDVPNAKKTISSKPCPLSKKKNTNIVQSKVIKEVEEKARAVIGKEAKGYSPPILPIPSYQQAFEILAKNEQKRTDILKKMETINGYQDVCIRSITKTTHKESKNKEFDSKPQKDQIDKGPKSKPLDSKPTKAMIAPEKINYEKTKKISLEEYKKKLANNNVTVRDSSKSKCKKRRKQSNSQAEDLGYDSDATFVF